MGMANYITSRDLVLMLKSRTKKGALAELTRAVARRLPGIPYESILAAVWEREKILTTKTAPGIAIPHARIPGLDYTTIAFGKSAAGIDYDTKENGKVHLVILIVGGEGAYLKALGEVASHLQNTEVVERMMRATGKKELYELLTRPLSGIISAEKPSLITRAVYEQALKLAKLVQASAVMIHDPPASLKGIPFPKREDLRLIHAYTESRPEPAEHAGVPQRLFVPFRGLNRSSRIEITLLLALSKGLVNKGEKVISVFGLASSAAPDTIVVTDVDREFRMFFSMPLEKQPEDLDQQVFIRVLQVATEIANEGREGKPVGTLFVVGDYLHVSKHCQQLVMNPFNGYQDHEKNVLDPGIAETIKEFSRIDGAFIIRGDGVIVSAGTYLRVEHPIRNLPPGLGARHAAAAGITATTGAIAIAISESTRHISLFSAGERIMVV
jgi:DNA integrity scanning protein DisA with diadenylate cyclase activity/mannitol/fructose-specific phosphotransferase system IIA component (Ntr-type)